MCQITHILTFDTWLTFTSQSARSTGLTFGTTERAVSILSDNNNDRVRPISMQSIVL